MADLKGIKHIFFDFDDTLWDFRKNSSATLYELFSEFRLSEKLGVDFDTFNEVYQKINLDLWSKYYKRQIDKNALRFTRFEMAFAAFGYRNKADSQLVTQLYTERAPRGTFLKEGCREVLSYLREKYALHIITNGFSEVQAIKIDGCNLRPYFNNIIIADEHDLVKPEEQIFRIAEKLADATRDQCVMVGDSFESDITGAINAGWEAVYFTESPQLNYTGKSIVHLTELKALF